MAKIIAITEMAFEGSGYYYICAPLFTELSKMGHEIKVVGLSYNGKEHDYPFSIIPCQDINDAQAIAHNLIIMTDPDVNRIVKRFIRREEQGDPVYAGLPQVPAHARPRLRRVGRAIRAGDAAVRSNPRARSAVLRVAERLGA